MANTASPVPGAQLSDYTIEHHPTVVELRRLLHQNAEVGLVLPKTASIIEAELARLGIKHERCTDNGVVGLIEGKEPGPVVMLRADMDALPITEATSHEYVSQHKGAMHACGHDTHMAMQVGAIARLASEGIPRGTLKLVFQPGEEGHHGAMAMIKAGVLDNPKVDMAYGQHIWSGEPLGKILVESGPVMAAVDTVHIRITGKGCHAAMPQQGTDTVLTAAHVVTSLQSIVTRSVDPLQPAVVTVSMFHAGTAHNIIPPLAELTLSVRVFDDETHDLIEQRIHEIATGVAHSMGCEAEIDYIREHRPVVNDEEVTEIVREEAVAIVGADNVMGDMRTMGAEDFSDFLKKVPGNFTFIGARNEAKDCVYPHHHPLFNVDEDAFAIGTELMYRVAQRLLAR
jgi:amidohydrolase